MRRRVLPLLLFALLAPAAARAAAGHSKIGCTACHTVKKVSGNSAFCLQCHATREQGGRDILPVSRHVSHPFDIPSVNPRIAKVPTELLRADGRFECLSCHDPHPSNANYKYLRIETGPTGARMEAFCALCHPAKSGQAAGSPGTAKPRRG